MYKSLPLLIVAYAISLLGCATRSHVEHGSNTPTVRVTIADSISDDTSLKNYVSCIANSLVAGSLDLPVDDYLHIHIRDDRRINAVALTNKRIDVYTGLIDATQGDDQLAAVIAHELAHQVYSHPARRRTSAYATDTTSQHASKLPHKQHSTRSVLKTVFDTGWQMTTWPLRRSQESSADRLGLELTAGAGFDPRASIELWQKLELMYDDSHRPAFEPHPTIEQRIKTLQKYLPKVRKIYRRNKRNGASTQCNW